VGERKIFGSCFAHQLIAVAFGGRAGCRERAFYGWHRLTITREHPIFNGLDDPYFISLNADEVIEKPADAKVLATHEECRYQVLQYGDTIITCQSHPEIKRQYALDAIREHKGALLEKCPDLDDIVDDTVGYANDDLSDVFLANIIGWLRS
jgi:GMP synthase-like glutamine amidotransferase